MASILCRWLVVRGNLSTISTCDDIYTGRSLGISQKHLCSNCLTLRMYAHFIFIIMLWTMGVVPLTFPSMKIVISNQVFLDSL